MAEIHRRKPQYQRMDTWHMKSEVSRGEILARSQKEKVRLTPTTTERLKSGAKGLVKAGQKFACREDVKSTTKKLITFFKNYNKPRR